MEPSTKKMLKVTLIIVGAVTVLFTLAGFGMYLRGSRAIARIEAIELRRHDIAAIPDGEHAGSESYLLGSFDVLVTIENGRITGAVSTGDDGREYSVKARPVLERVVDSQSVKDVDAIAGATLCSKVYLSAVQNALDDAARAEKAR